MEGEVKVTQEEGDRHRRVFSTSGFLYHVFVRADWLRGRIGNIDKVMRPVRDSRQFQY